MSEGRRMGIAGTSLGLILPRGMEFASYLIKKVKALENENDSLKRTRRSLKILLGVSWIALASFGVALLRCSMA
ncbi:hypothetical protein CJ030_MR6G016566 [Morella rubra]|uniref:Uncharacterized protein n=1 Tax=Morella rubra TaxID=262757 RepID=A0A6A1V9I7_9ROSI|nr:hypothetical protein CJ030_MR6G016566 [Morella rubra]